MRASRVARHSGNVTRGVDNGNNKAAAKARQDRFTSALVGTQSEIGIGVLSAIGRVSKNFPVKEQAVKEPKKGPPFCLSYSAGQQASRLVE